MQDIILPSTEATPYQNAVRAKNNRSPKNMVGAYIRLSRDDGDKLESDSVTNQRAMIRDFVDKSNKNAGIPFSVVPSGKLYSAAPLKIVDEFIDDGYSGTNYDRPGFQRLMEAVKQGRINCIIVKDFSRLGRNYIETGRYLEEIFPMYGVRVISILDRYDNMNGTGDADEIIVPFKNLINDAYCRDISMKIRSHFEVKRRSGQFIGSFASYGYIKDPQNKNHLVIDPYAVEIVRTIFRMKIEGVSSPTIAEHLNEMGVLPPSEYKRFCGLNFNGGYRCADEPKWTHVPVDRILRNEMYTGTMVQGINQKVNYRVKEVLSVSKDKWIRVKGTHEAIIHPATFQRVQELLLLDTRRAPGNDSVYLLSGFLRCGDCGQNMVRRCTKYRDRIYSYYHCLTFKRHKGCSSHNICEKDLQELVLEAIRQQVRIVIKGEQLSAEIEKKKKDNIHVRTLDKQMKILSDEIKRYKELKNKLYTDKLDGVVSSGEYVDICRRFDTKVMAAQKKYSALEEKKEQLLNVDTPLRPWMETFKKYRDVRELSREMIVALIKDITIYKGHRIEIHFRYEEELQKIFLQTGR